MCHISHSPGQRVPTAAVYNLVDENGQHAGREETLEQGATFPPTRGGYERAYQLYQIVRSPSPRRFAFRARVRRPSFAATK
jgi:hypothetical protein